MNLWHDLSAGTEEQLNVVVEIAKGSKNKYEIDKITGLIKLDRVSHTSQDFPFDYGFVPQTLWADGDPLDVILLTTYPLLTGILVEARPVALVNMTDGGDSDDKIIAVPAGDPRWEKTLDLSDLNPHTLKEIEHFYSTYKQLKNKEVKVTGFANRAKAVEVFQQSCTNYQAKFAKK